MSTIAQRMLAGTIIVCGIVTPAAAQQPGANSRNLPPHVADHLWPERELSPVEQEFKDRVIVMRDTLTRVHATVALVERQQRSGAAGGVIRSSARTLAADCGRSERAAVSMAAFAVDFKTNDPKWGDPSVRAFRSAVTDLTAGMRRCVQTMTAEIDAATPNVDRVLSGAATAAGAVAKYERAESDLLRTLKIRVDPKQPGTPAR